MWPCWQSSASDSLGLFFPWLRHEASTRFEDGMSKARKKTKRLAFEGNNAEGKPTN
jgi:hypothetical protein